MLVDAATLAPRLVVELDDASHDRADRHERDVFLDEVLAGVGFPILRVRWQRHYDPRALAVQLTTAMGMAAPTLPSAEPVRSLVATASFAPAPKPKPAVAASSEPVPPASVPAAPLANQVVDAPAFGMTVAPAPAASSRRACGQCQAELSAGAKFCA